MTHFSHSFASLTVYSSDKILIDYIDYIYHSPTQLTEQEAQKKKKKHIQADWIHFKFNFTFGDILQSVLVHFLFSTPRYLFMLSPFFQTSSTLPYPQAQSITLLPETEAIRKEFRQPFLPEFISLHLCPYNLLSLQLLQMNSVSLRSNPFLVYGIPYLLSYQRCRFIQQ